MAIAFTGTRRIPADKVLFVLQKLQEIAADNGTLWMVGDAPGIDDLVLSYAQKHDRRYALFQVEGKERWHFAKRTKNMIDSLERTKEPKLYAFPNKSCPEGCNPKTLRGCGSGTWLAIAYAVKLGVPVEIIPLVEINTPAWIFSDQLSLL
jgi:hypothetical protein